MIIINIFLTSFFAAISPGPNLYFVISQTGISKKNGLFSAFGVIFGVLFWLILLSFGFNFFLKNKFFIVVLGLFSGLYLFYLGFNCLFRDNVTKKEIKKTDTFDGHLKTFTKSSLLALFNIEIPAFYGAIFTNIANKESEIFSTLAFFKNFFQLIKVENNYLLLFLFFSLCFLLIESFVFFSSVFIFSFFNTLKKNINKINKILGIFIIYYAVLIFISAAKTLQFLY